MQEASSSEASRPKAFMTPDMKATDFFDETWPFKIKSFIHSFQLIFHHDRENFSEDRKKALHATSFLFGRAAKWIEPYLYNITNQDPAYLLNTWAIFKYQLFSFFGDLNEFRKAEAELDGIRIKEGGHVSLYISDFRSLVARIGD
ncbi:hypothetical protein O181_057256 [Austropuccinia psidii MF-1]|uniref:Retrotransposon gag domain-containing protein n=1 Tax=Austropuccinia psidii MF-1 TaxID=1389203 RepID=A0A9Q3HTR4_9BASI|nr:hypothetical protein [Austropuccinia psidii MF-1]